MFAQGPGHNPPLDSAEASRRAPESVIGSASDAMEGERKKEASRKKSPRESTAKKTEPEKARDPVLKASQILQWLSALKRMDIDGVKAQVEILEDHITSFVNKTAPTARTEQASSLELLDACELTGVQYEDTEEYVWQLSGVNAGSPTPRGTSWLDDALKDFRTDKVWRSAMAHTENMSRTTIDMIMFDRLKYVRSKFPELPLQDLRVAAKVSLSVPAANVPHLTITGKADWLYSYRFSTGKEQLDSTLIAIEAKRPAIFSSAMTQLMIYLAAIQRSRILAAKYINTVFGFATDGLQFCFAKLDYNQKLSISRTYTAAVDTEIIYAWIDTILLTAAHSSLNTTPTKQRRFCTDPTKFTEKVGQPLFTGGVESAITGIDEWLAEDDADLYEILDIGSRSDLVRASDFNMDVDMDNREEN